MCSDLPAPILATFLQKIAIAVAGFVAGGKLAVAVTGAFVSDAGELGSYWLIFIIGGIIGSILLLSLFDWALIFLSAIVGADLIVSPFPSGHRAGGSFRCPRGHRDTRAGGGDRRTRQPAV